jgi:hypothetical protein
MLIPEELYHHHILAILWVPATALLIRGSIDYRNGNNSNLGPGDEELSRGTGAGWLSKPLLAN